MDLKCPSSGESERNRWENLTFLKATDEIKFVIGTLQDYEWAVAVIARHRLMDVCPLLFLGPSLVDGTAGPGPQTVSAGPDGYLAAGIGGEDHYRRPARALSGQLHKSSGHPRNGGVIPGRMATHGGVTATMIIGRMV